MINAASTFTGTIIVFNGITQIFPEDDENSIATILSHEMGHVIGSHIIEGFSNLVLYSMASILFPVLVPVLFLPFMLGGGLSMVWDSRIHENEADYISLFLMAKADYEIRTVPDFWSRMKNVRNQKRIPDCDHPDLPEWLELLSSHPLVSLLSTLLSFTPFC